MGIINISESQRKVLADQSLLNIQSLKRNDLMSTNIYLYLKTHNKTGLKYLGKTTRNPFTYKGSGYDWVPHLEEHGNDVTTEILFETTDPDEFYIVSKNYSKKWNIAESNEFANRILETGGGPGAKENHVIVKDSNNKTFRVHVNDPRYLSGELISVNVGKTHSTKSKQLMSDKQFAAGGYGPKKHSVETIIKMSKSSMGHEVTEETKLKLSKANKGRKFKTVKCPHCEVTGAITIMKRWHFNNCRNIK